MTKEAKVPEIEVKIQKRFLRFINEAQSYKDLVIAAQLPVKQLFRDIQRYKGPVEYKQAEPVMNEKEAQQIIKSRNELSPLYGFLNINDFRNAIKIDLDRWLIDWIIPWFGPATRGKWDDTGYCASIPVAQAALVHTPDDHHNGRVLMIERDFNDFSRTPLWKPEANSYDNAFEENSPYPPGKNDALKDMTFRLNERNLYCSGHSFLSDGKLLAVGGGGDIGDVSKPDMGWIFDPQLKEWDVTRKKYVGTSHNNREFMTIGRWYPTAITLGDDSGRVLIVGGGREDGDPSSDKRQMEVYHEDTGVFSKIDGPLVGGVNQSYWPYNADYPGLHLLRDGKIYFTRAVRWGVANATSLFSFITANSGQWSELAEADDGQSSISGMSVLMLGDGGEPDRVLVVGGSKGSAGSDEVKVMTLPPVNGASWESFEYPDPEGAKKRQRANTVLLPDGTAFISGGTNNVGDNSYIFDPTRMNGNPLLPMDNLTETRNSTHDQALLLPSAQVVTMGTNVDPETWKSIPKRISVFSPPYLFKANGEPADRPHITSWPNPDNNEFIYHGQNFNITTPHACSIGKVVLVKPMAVTHQMDTEQRVIVLNATATDEHTMQVRAPNGYVSAYGSSHTHAVAPRGVYMLFILNSDGVPSKAKFVRLL